jgi:hypothetical protein
MSVLIENGINVDEIIKKPRKPRMKKIVEQAVRQNSRIEELDIVIQEEVKVEEVKVEEVKVDEVKVDVAEKVEEVEVKVEEGLTEPTTYRCDICNKSFRSSIIFGKHGNTAVHKRAEMALRRM